MNSDLTGRVNRDVNRHMNGDMSAEVGPEPPGRTPSI